jgi:hypothetical protein
LQERTLTTSAQFLGPSDLLPFEDSVVSITWLLIYPPPPCSLSHFPSPFLSSHQYSCFKPHTSLQHSLYYPPHAWHSIPRYLLILIAILDLFSTNLSCHDVEHVDQACWPRWDAKEQQVRTWSVVVQILGGVVLVLQLVQQRVQMG